MLFGYEVGTKSELEAEQRGDRLWWPLLGGTFLCLVYLFSGRPFAREIFQGFFATTLCYGMSFYVRRRNNLGSLWLWKGIFATVPLHIVYLAGIFWSDKLFPNFMTKSIVFIPVLGFGFAIESILFDRIVDWFTPAVAHE